MPSADDSVTAVELVDPLVGSIFDKRFRIEERLAAGGFGAIYRATHVKSGHPIALKVLHPTLASDLGVLARFRREGTTLTSLRNPHTITAYEFGQVDKTLFIVLELLHGETLFERYSMNGPMEWKRVVHVAKQVCESLAEAHAQGIVHRDLKPTNIHLEMHDEDPDFVKVLDFGIAKILRGSEHDSQDITNAGQMIGTLDYMSPEQMVGGQVTGQTDIYTLGIVMYEMIAGTRPFPESATATAALASMLKTTPEPLYLRAPIPRELDAIVMKCLERETQKRFRSVTELRGELDRLVRDGVSATTATVLLPKRNFDEHDETAITPPPERLLDAMRTPGASRKTPVGEDTRRTPKVDIKTPKVERTPKSDPRTPKLDSKTPSVDAKTPRVERDEAANTPRMERARSARLAEWEEDDEIAPTTTRRPDGQDDGGIPSLAARSASGGVNARVMASPVIPPTPSPRPLESRHQPTPVPQLVVAPFSQSPRTPPPNDPRMKPPTQPPPVGDPRSRTPPGQPPFASTVPGFASPLHGQQVPNLVPGAGPVGATTVGVPPPPPPGYPGGLHTTPMHGAPVQYGQPAGYDMSRAAAQDAAARRLIWIVVLVLAGVVGIILAMRL